MVDPVTISLVSAAAGVLGAAAGVKSVSQAHKAKHGQQPQRYCNCNPPSYYPPFQQRPEKHHHFRRWKN